MTPARILQELLLLPENLRVELIGEAVATVRAPASAASMRVLAGHARVVADELTRESYLKECG